MANEKKFIDVSYMKSFWNRLKNVITETDYTLNDKSQTIKEAIDDLGDVKEDVDNKITEWCETPDDEHYPSEKLVKTEFTTIQNQINALSLGLKLALSVTPSPGPKGEAQSYKWTATFTGATPDTITIYDETGAVFHSGTKLTSINKSITKTLTSKLTYTAQATYMGMTFTASASTTPYYKILYGFCTGAAHPTLKLGVRTTAIGGVCVDTATADGQKFKIYIPSGVTLANNFKMGGAPANFVKGDTITLNGISYTPFETGDEYDTGAKLSIEMIQ